MPSSSTKVGRGLLVATALLALLYALVFLPGQKHTPKLGIDLAGGTRVIFTAKTPHNKTPSSSSLEQARNIIEERVNGNGVTQATVQTQGDNQLIVSIPSATLSNVDQLGKASILNFRGLVAPATPISCTPPSAKPGVKAPATPCNGNLLQVLRKVQPNFAFPTSEAAYEKLSTSEQNAIRLALSHYNCGTAENEIDNPKADYIACDASGNAFLLSPVVVAGTQIDSAVAQQPNPQSGQDSYGVALTLKDKGSGEWAKYTGAHNISKLGSSAAAGANPASCSTATVPCADFVAFTLDGAVISSPVNQTAINGQTTLITGNFTDSSSRQLAQSLKYGALPLSFTADENEHVSATLGGTQLKDALIAGGIGLALVVLYSLIYYRGLGLITISSLLVSGGFTYAALVLLGRQIGFVLDLAGIAGFIVALGITADSFVVFFERIKDEVHGGRSVLTAVPRAWVRARRTILAADTVSFLAAATLYYFASADVRGFAFTLGLSTILDLLVVFLFTHPIMLVLSRTRAFGSPRFTGLNSLRPGGAAPQASKRGGELVDAGVTAGEDTSEDPAYSGKTSAQTRAAERRKRLAAQEESGTL